MISIEQIDLMAHGGSMALLALWSWLLVRDHWTALPARMAVAMNAGIISYLIVTAGSGRAVGITAPLLVTMAGATPGLFWLFARSWFNDETRLRPIAVLLVVVAAANTLIVWLTFAERDSGFVVSGVIFRIMMFGFAAAGLWEAWRGREGDLVEGRRRLRPRLIAAVGCYVVIIAVAEMAVFNGGMSRWIIRLIGSSTVLVIFLFCVAMFGFRQDDLFRAMMPEVKPQAARAEADNGLAGRIALHMETTLAWRDETLTISSLAAQLGEQEYRLRRAINGHLGHRNFAAFLNGYRLAEVKTALADATQKDVPIITIALDAGFGSLGPFNRAFREAEGITPSEYRTANRTAS
jgi:AraC-like DNA-binding protein